MDVLTRGQKPSDLITRESLENAILAVAASGGSTNGVLHLLAVAREAGVAARHRRLRPHRGAARRRLCDLKPGGRFVATDLHAAGGTAVLAKRLKEPGLLHEDAPDRHRQDDRRARRRGRRGARPGGHPPARQPDQEDRRASRSCAATSRPRAASSSSPATSAATTAARRACSRARRRRWRPSPAARSTPATSSSSATRARPAARACARCSPSPRRSWGRGSATPSRCSPTAASPAPPAASWPATSRPRRSTAARSRAVREGDTITIDVDDRRIDLDVPDDEIERARSRTTSRPSRRHARRAGQVRRAGVERLRGRDHAAGPGAGAGASR